MPQPQATPVKRANRPNLKGPKASTFDLCKILMVGILFHLVAVMSIFDIYFKSPLSQGQQPTNVLPNAPAKRLFFIIGDGLRADKCFAVDGPDQTPRARFLHSMASTKGCFGVSHTRVPTESRPGHVAMLAGFYEDPSAITKGWKENPVDYDHVVTRAQWAFTFGAPEIVSLFPGERVSGGSYPESLVDFGLGKGVLEQDEWPFDRIFELFDAAKSDLELNDKLRSDRVFFLLHLLGHDTNGHAYGPHSTEYADNTRYIDQKVQELVKRVEEFYNDEKSVFLFTADHGMSDGRSHGDGDPDNTRTPLILWGAGVAGPESDDSYGTQDAYSARWGSLASLRRRDIRQADLAPLVSSLIGIPIPVQSEGQLPVEFLRNKRFAAQALLRNAKQMLENYRVKETLQRQKHTWWAPFIPYKTSVIAAQEIMAALEQKTDIEKCQQLCKEISNGIAYLNNYDQTFLFVLMTAGFVGWIAFGLLAVVKLYTAYGCFYTERTFVADPAYLACTIVYLALSVFLYGRSSPLHYYLYAFFPAWFGKKVLQSRDLFYILHSQQHLIFDSDLVKTSLRYLFITELIVLAYLDRRWMSAIYGLGMTETGSKAMPSMSSVALSIFTVLPTIKSPDMIMYTAGSALAFAVLVQRRLFVQAGLELLAFTGAILADQSLSTKQGLPVYCKALNWFVLCASPLLFALQKRHSKSIHSLFAALVPIMTVLSVSYEVAFFTCFYWYQQHRLQKQSLDSKPERWLRSHDLLLTAEFVAAINMAFFGTGNIASLSSFQLPSVYRLITAFRPFAMGGLLILKQLIPLVFLAPVLIQSATKSSLPPFAVFLLACSLIDLITVQFFFKVTNVGSWLEIGEGISRFVISSVFILVALMMYGVGEWLSAMMMVV